MFIMTNSRFSRRFPLRDLPSKRTARRARPKRHEPRETGEAEDREKIAALREKLTDAGSFPGVMDEFLAGLGSDPRFLLRGHRVEDALLEAAMIAVAERLDGAPVEPVDVRTVALPEHEMKHGMVFFEGWIGIFLFFDDTGIGLVAMSRADLRAGTFYVRFTRVEARAEERGTSN
jgi:hypothetical protein